MLFGVDGTICFVKNTSRDYEIEIPSIFFEKFVRQSQSATPEAVPDYAKIVQFMAQPCRFPIS